MGDFPKSGHIYAKLIMTINLQKSHREYVASNLMQGISPQHTFDQIWDGLHDRESIWIERK